MKKIVEAHETKMDKLREEIEDKQENFEVEKAKRENFEDDKNKLQKTVEYLRSPSEKCFSTITDSYKKLKNMFSSVEAWSSNVDYVYGNTVGSVKWVDGEVEAFNEIFSTREDYYACIGVRSITLIPKKASYSHIKIVGKLGFKMLKM
jgi:predicted nuclease with TOPRIM domain